MKTLDQHNNEIYLEWAKGRSHSPNGIECPHCKEELMDEDLSMVILTNPRQVRIYCVKCGFRGHRYLKERF